MNSTILLANLDSALEDFTNNFQAPQLDLTPKFSLNWENHEFEEHLTRVPRSPCPSGVGNHGFNSFNFLTFMIMVFNAVANVNNNINNNNQNNQDLNFNSISQDSNNVVSNSDNQNTVMAIILPVPGRKKRSVCPLMTQDLIKNLIELIQKAPHCSDYFICKGLLQIGDFYQLNAVSVKYFSNNLVTLTISQIKTKTFMTHRFKNPIFLVI